MIRSVYRIPPRMAVIMLALVTSACATEPVQTVIRPKPTPAAQVPAQSMMKSALLGPGDVVDVFVWGYSDFSRRATVNFSGALPYPMLGEIPVAGKSVRQVQEEIRVALTDYIKEPIVRVSVATTRPLKVHVLGEVKNPGAYPLSSPQTTLVEAVGQAGGLTTDARQNAIVLVRNAGEEIHIHRVDFRRITREGDLGSNLPLQEGDVIYVPVAYMADIAREARRIVDIVAALVIIENAALLFEPFYKVLTHAPDRPGASSAPPTIIVQ